MNDATDPADREGLFILPEWLRRFPGDVLDGLRSVWRDIDRGLWWFQW